MLTLQKDAFVVLTPTARVSGSVYITELLLWQQTEQSERGESAELDFEILEK